MGKAREAKVSLRVVLGVEEEEVGGEEGSGRGVVLCRRWLTVVAVGGF